MQGVVVNGIQPSKVLKDYNRISGWTGIAFAIAVVACLANYNYLLFHTFIELFCIVVAFGVFIIATNTYHFARNNYFTFLGITYGSIAIMDFLHALSYKGMGIFPGLTANTPTQLWIIAQYMGSVSLLSFTVFSDQIKTVRIRYIILAYLAIDTTFLLAVFYWGNFPDCYIEGIGLTPFKVRSELLVIGIKLLASLFIYKKKLLFSTNIRILLIGSLVTGAAAEVAFMMYVDVYGLWNMTGHVFKFISYYFIYRALVKSTLEMPYQSLYDEIVQTNTDLHLKTQELTNEIEQRNKMEREIFRLQSLHLVGEMAAGIGHEVRNPITSVRGYLQYFELKPSLEQYRDQFRLMIEELDRANYIITEFLSLAKNKAIQPREHNLNQLVKNMCPLLEANAFIAQKTVETRLEDTLCVFVDEKEVRQLIMNLVKNGLEAMAPGGRVLIETYMENGKTVLAIRDQGTGIPEEIAAKIGTPFFSTKPEGTGLGLAVCYSIAARHKAHIEFATSSQGTVFFVRFNAVQQAA